MGWRRSAVPGASPALAFTAAVTATAWTDGRVVGCGADRSDQGRARRQPVPRRGPSQGVGAVALRRHSDLVAPGASADARARPAGPWPCRLTTRPTQP